MSKGSGRRPKQVSDEQFAKEYDRIFGTKRPEEEGLDDDTTQEQEERTEEEGVE